MQHDISQKCRTIYCVSSPFCIYIIISNLLRGEHFAVTLSCIFTVLASTVLTFGKFKNYTLQKYVLGFLLAFCLTVYGYDDGILAYNQGTFLAIVCLCSLHLDRKLNISLGVYMLFLYAIAFTFAPQELYSNREELRNVMLRIVTISIGQIMLIILINHIQLQQRQSRASSLNRSTLLKIVEEKRDDALAANSAKSDFLANMSHEIRTPMNAIIGISEIVLRADISPEVRENMLCILNSSKSLVGIINEILDFSKIESGTFEINATNYNLTSTIYDISAITLLSIEKKPIEFVVDVDERLPLLLFGDETRIRQIMLNFVTNAAKYTNTGTISLKVWSEYIEQSTILLHIRVADTGIGIQQSDMGRLFSAFMQVDTRKNRLVEGTGLGLAITKRLAEIMKGTIAVESKYGVGSVFSVSIPQRVVDSTPIGEFSLARPLDAEARQHETFTAPGAQVLVVDDNKVNILVAKGVLDRYRLNITTAASAQECFALVRQQSFDIIFMDHMMPVMDGLEATRILRAEGTTTPIIALTANASAGAQAMYMAAGFDGYFSKPIIIHELEDILLKFLPAERVVRTPTPITQPVVPCVSVQQPVPVHPAHMARFSEKITRLICEEGRKKLPLLERYWEKKEWHNYAIEVHSLKTTARYCGNEELYSLAQEQEAAERQGNFAPLEAGFTRLREVYADLLRSIAPEARGVGSALTQAGALSGHGIASVPEQKPEK